MNLMGEMNWCVWLYVAIFVFSWINIYHFYIDSLKWLLRQTHVYFQTWKSTQVEAANSLLKMVKLTFSFHQRPDQCIIKKLSQLSLHGPKHGEDRTRKLELKMSSRRELERPPEFQRLSSEWLLMRSREGVMRMQKSEMLPLINRRRNSRIETLRKWWVRKPPNHPLRIRRKHQLPKLLPRSRLLKAARDD